MKSISILLFVIFISLVSAINTIYANDNVTNEAKIIILGDSLIAGYGLEEKDNFPSQLKNALKAQGYNVSITNAGVSGDTTTGGLERLEWSIADGYDLLIIALGANDGLRGIDPDITKDNLEKIIIQARELAPDTDIALFGMLAPPNLGTDYSQKFNDIYPYLSKKYDVPLYPFFLEGVVMNQDLNQKDGIHPNPKGVGIIVDNILPYFIKLIQ